MEVKSESFDFFFPGGRCLEISCLQSQGETKAWGRGRVGRVISGAAVSRVGRGK